jgi:hypothetical protein
VASHINEPTDPEDLARVIALSKDGRPNSQEIEKALASRIHHFAEIPDLLSMEVTPIDYLVDGMISRKSLTLWAGIDGTAKTLLAQKMGLAVAAGHRFLGRQCRQAPVLYLDYENPDFAVRERLELLSGTEKPNPNFKVWGTWLEQQPPPIGSEVLFQIAKEVRPLLIIDPFRYSHTAEENDSTEMMLVMQALRSYAAAGAAVVVLHHPAKTEGSTGRGSSAIRGAVDVAYLQEMSEETDLITLKCVKNRFGERLTVTIKPDFDEGTFEVTDSPAFKKRQEEIERLRLVITTNPGMSKSKIQAMHGGKRTRVFRLLTEHEGQFWEARPDGQSVRYFPIADNQFPQKGTGVGTGEPVEGTGTSSPVPSLIEGTGGNWVPRNPDTSSPARVPVTKLQHKATVCPHCLKLSMSHYSDGTQMCDFCGPDAGRVQ